MNKDFQENNETLNNLQLEHDPVKDFFYFIWDLFKTGVVVFLIAFAIRYFLIQPFIVEGNSMLPTFVSEEYLLAEKLSYLISEPQRGDIVIFKYPRNPSQSYIKRIVGLPGETVVIENDQVKVQDGDNTYILNEDYLSSDSETNVPRGDRLETSLKGGEYFVLGDNREHSSDSREWGVLPESNIIGRAWLTIKPLERFGIHKRVQYESIRGSSLGLLPATPGQ